MRKASGLRARFQFGNVLRGRCSCGSGLTARGLAKAFALRPIVPAKERLKISAFAGTLAQIWGAGHVPADAARPVEFNSTGLLLRQASKSGMLLDTPQ
jgi:hypothetical protein